MKKSAEKLATGLAIITTFMTPPAFSAEKQAQEEDTRQRTTEILTQNLEDEQKGEFKEDLFHFQYKNKTHKNIDIFLDEGNENKVLKISIDGLVSDFEISSSATDVMFEKTDDPTKIRVTWTNLNPGAQMGRFYIDAPLSEKMKTKTTKKLLKTYKDVVEPTDKPNQIRVITPGLVGGNAVYEITPTGEWKCLDYPKEVFPNTEIFKDFIEVYLEEFEKKNK